VQAYTVVIHSAGVPPANVFSEILQVGNVQQPAPAQPVTINARLSRDEYIDIIKKLKAHIQRGDCYELNFCQEFYACPATINPLTVYNRLAAVSPAPFACFYRLYDKYLLCASPERYIKKTGSSIISQPMKGTAKRDPEDTDADEALKVALACSSKDQAENVMVVDLVRNDLAKICAEGSVYASRLFEIQTFPQVHQMVSTVSGTLLPAVDLSDVLQATFPMGSMTGAPKKRVLELVEQYENLNRGIFSGAVGYISPGNDFDFNVVIRSIMYNAATQYVSYIVGSGITFYSNEEKEYEECLLKALAMAKALS
jgi:para-aminobenzoate synthetase component 1